MIKKDKIGKLEMDRLVEFYPALEDLVRVIQFGSEKYEPLSWKKVDPADFRGAMMRHTMKYLKGEEVDEESGIHHLAHAAWNCLAILTLEIEAEDGNYIL